MAFVASSACASAVKPADAERPDPPVVVEAGLSEPVAPERDAAREHTPDAAAVSDALSTGIDADTPSTDVLPLDASPSVAPPDGADLDAPLTCAEPERNVPLGFNVLFNGSQSATVLDVTADALVLATERGETIEFGWSGPALPFHIGERVIADWPLGRSWHSVRSPSGTVATYVDRYTETNALRVPDFAGGPRIGYFEQCVVPPARLFDCCVFPSRQVSSLVASLGRDNAFVSVGASGSVGPWTVTNVGNMTNIGDDYCAGASCLVTRTPFLLVTLRGPGTTM